MPPVTVRRARTADLPALMPLAEAYCAADHHAFDDGRVRGALLPLLDDDTHGMVLVAESESGIVGYAVLTWGYSIESGGVESLLDELYVVEQRRGLGSALLGACLDAARAHGARSMFLETEAHNDGARRLYERHGFLAEDSVWMARDLM